MNFIHYILEVDNKLNMTNDGETKDSLKGLSLTLEQTLTSLNARKSAMVAQKEQYEKLEINSESNDTLRLIHLGDDYFVEKHSKDVSDFLNRRIKDTNEILEEMNGKIRDAEEMLRKLADLEKTDTNSAETNEEGLPFMDIQEELDEDDNIIGHMINGVKNVLPESKSKTNTRKEKNTVVLGPRKTNVGSSIGKHQSKNRIKRTTNQVNKSTQDSSKTILNANKTAPVNDSCITTQLNNELHKTEHISTTPQVDKTLYNAGMGLESSSAIKLETSKKLLRTSSFEDSKDKAPSSSDILVKNNKDEIKDLLEDMEIRVLKPTDKSKLEVDKISKMLDEIDISDEHRHALRSIYEEDGRYSINSNLEGGQIAEVPLNDTEGTLAGSIQHDLNMRSSVEIDQNDILQLEILADDVQRNFDTREFDEYDEQSSGSESEDDLNSISDELLYGSRGFSFIPSGMDSNSRQGKDYNEVLWDEVAKLRSQKQPISSKIGDKTKSVKFDDNVEVNEVENISDELKAIKHDNKISRFKENHLRKHLNSTSISSDRSAEDKNEPSSGPVLDIVERKYNAWEENPVLDIVERNYGARNQNALHIGGDETKAWSESNTQDCVRDKDVQLPPECLSENASSPRNSFSNKNSSPIQTDTIYVDLCRLQMILADKNVGQLCKTHVLDKTSVTQLVEDHYPETPGSTGVNHTRPIVPIDHTIPSIRGEDYINETRATDNLLGFQHDMNLMAQAYNKGFYDDDINMVGPIVNKIEDFDILNEKLESDLNPNTSLGEIPSNEDGSNINDAYVSEKIIDDMSDHSDSDEPILVDVDEKDFESFHDPDAVVLQQEIRKGYYMLRNKIFPQRATTLNNETNEFEPVDENGNTVRISRFKASRLK